MISHPPRASAPPARGRRDRANVRRGRVPSDHASGHRNTETAESSPYAVNQAEQPAAEPAQDYNYQSEETNDPGNSDSDFGGGSDSVDT